MNHWMIMTFNYCALFALLVFFCITKYCKTTSFHVISFYINGYGQKVSSYRRPVKNISRLRAACQCRYIYFFLMILIHIYFSFIMIIIIKPVTVCLLKVLLIWYIQYMTFVIICYIVLIIIHTLVYFCLNNTFYCYFIKWRRWLLLLCDILIYGKSKM